MCAKTIGIIAAMPEEIRTLLKSWDFTPLHRLEHFNLYRMSIGNTTVFLIESGIGMEKAAEACVALMRVTVPDIIVSIGFGGTPRPGIAVGDVVIATSLLLYQQGVIQEQSGLDPESAASASAAIEAGCCDMTFQVHQGTFITTAEIADKTTVAKLLPSLTENLLMEMETAAVARTCSETKTPCIAVRSVSDGAEETLNFAISSFVDEQMRIRASKVFYAVLKNPSLIPQLMRLERNSRIAGKNLACAVSAFLRS